MFDLAAIRSQFPALSRQVGPSTAAYLDGPGGTQVPKGVIDAMAEFLSAGGSNLHGSFASSRETDAVLEAARAAVADLYGARPDEIVFGQNMTSLTYAASRAIARTWSPGDNIVLSRLDHDANVTPWTQAALDAGVEVRWIDFVPERGCTLDLDTLDAALDPRTRLVAFSHASNAVGTITPVSEIVERAHGVGALTYVDAVHYTPHGLVDVGSTGTDFLVSSSYKWFGPHIGCLFGRAEHLDTIEPYKLRPSPDTAPDRWETGTQSFESLAGVTAAVDYLASLGEGDDRRSRLIAASERIARHEADLSERFLAGIAEMPSVSLAGRTDSEGRTPTFAIDVAGRLPSEVAGILGEAGIFVWSGDYYAVEVMARLGRSDHGMVRIGFVHYNTKAEVDRVLGALGALT
jgi:cysteine desulfurase family protein (TIGR01976 family)